MSESQNKVQIGTQVAEECGQALGEILTTVSELDVLVEEIATASREQSTGIREISKAMGQMEQVVQENSSAAQASSLTADNLKMKSSELKQVILALNEFVEGEPTDGRKPAAKTAQNVVSFADKKVEKKKKVKQPEAQAVASAPTAPVVKTEPTEHHDVKKAASGDFGPSSKHPGFKE